MDSDNHSQSAGERDRSGGGGGRSSDRKQIKSIMPRGINYISYIRSGGTICTVAGQAEYIVGAIYHKLCISTE